MTKNVLEALDKAVAMVKENNSKLLIQLDQTVIKPKTYQKYPEPGEYVVHRDYYYGDKSLNSSDIFKGIETVVGADSRLAKYKEVLEQYKKALEPILAQNKEIEAHNEGVKTKIRLFMQAHGIKDSYTKANYCKKKTFYDSHRAGYLYDLDRDIGCKAPEPLFNPEGSLKRVEKEYTNVIEEIKKKDAEKQATKAKAQQIHKVALLRAKYTPDNALSTVQDILDIILFKDKYLALGHALYQNRNDWNDGYSYAQGGLNCFNIETPEDRLIVDELQKIINQGRESGDIDGRVFRDCNYSFDVLFGKVADETLLKDYWEVINTI